MERGEEEMTRVEQVKGSEKIECECLVLLWTNSNPQKPIFWLRGKETCSEMSKFSSDLQRQFRKELAIFSSNMTNLKKDFGPKHCPSPSLHRRRCNHRVSPAPLSTLARKSCLLVIRLHPCPGQLLETSPVNIITAFTDGVVFKK